MQNRFEVIKRVGYEQLHVSKVLMIFTTVFTEYGGIIPFTLLAPAYFSGRMSLGAMFQIRAIVDQLSGALTYPIDAYSTAVGWRAVTDRLVALQAASSKAALDQVRVQKGLALEVSLVVQLPPSGHLPGRTVVEFNCYVERKQRILVHGPAGSGKSLVVKSLAGVWPHVAVGAQIVRPLDVMFVGDFDFPSMPLRNLLMYPLPAIQDTQCARAALEACGLWSLVDAMVPVSSAEASAGPVFQDPSSLEAALDCERDWRSVLSLQQMERVLLCRVLLRRPGFVVLDEPLRSLPVQERRCLIDLLPAEMGVLTFASNDELAPQHHHVRPLDQPGASSWRSTADTRFPKPRLVEAYGMRA